MIKLICIYHRFQEYLRIFKYNNNNNKSIPHKNLQLKTHLNNNKKYHNNRFNWNNLNNKNHHNKNIKNHNNNKNNSNNNNNNNSNSKNQYNNNNNINNNNKNNNIIIIILRQKSKLANLVISISWKLNNSKIIFFRDWKS